MKNERVNPYAVVAFLAGYFAVQTGANLVQSLNRTPTQAPAEAATTSLSPAVSHRLDLAVQPHMHLDFDAQPRDVQLVLNRVGFQDWMDRFQENCGNCIVGYDRRSYNVAFKTSAPMSMLPTTADKDILSLGKAPKTVLASGLLRIETPIMSEAYGVVHVNQWGEGYFVRQDDKVSITLNPNEPKRKGPEDMVILAPAELNAYSGTKAAQLQAKRD